MKRLQLAVLNMGGSEGGEAPIRSFEMVRAQIPVLLQMVEK